MATTAGQEGTGAASLRRDGEMLVFAGVLAREAVAALWRQALPQLAGVRRLDLTAVRSVDSAGLALLAELSARSGGAAVDGLPDGLGDLRDAYRLDDTLAFAR
jgi:phospholipid transport system transporter-binding protein